MFFDTRTIGADWVFVHEELTVSGRAFQNGDTSTGYKAILYSGIIGVSAFSKTIAIYANPFMSHSYVKSWYNISNIGVDNMPSNK